MSKDMKYCDLCSCLTDRYETFKNGHYQLCNECVDMVQDTPDDDDKSNSHGGFSRARGALADIDSEVE